MIRPRLLIGVLMGIFCGPSPQSFAHFNCNEPLATSLELEVRKLFHHFRTSTSPKERQTWGQILATRMQAFRVQFLAKLDPAMSEAEKAESWRHWSQSLAALEMTESIKPAAISPPTIPVEKRRAQLGALVKQIVFGGKNKWAYILKQDGRMECIGHKNPFGYACADFENIKSINKVTEGQDEYFVFLRNDGTLRCLGGIQDEDRGTDPDFNCGGGELKNIKAVYNTRSAFAVLTNDGKVKCFGRESRGGKCTGLRNWLNLRNVVSITATQGAFAALKSDGSVICWGYKAQGGQCEDLKDVSSLAATAMAFAALKKDGSIRCWGDGVYGGHCENLVNMKSVVASDNTFAALRSNGTIQCWENIQFDDDCAGIQGATHLYATRFGFLAVRADGSAQCWQESGTGYIRPSTMIDRSPQKVCDEYQHQFNKIREVLSTREGMLIQHEKGTLFTWGTRALTGEVTSYLEDALDALEIKGQMQGSQGSKR